MNVCERELGTPVCLSTFTRSLDGKKHVFLHIRREVARNIKVYDSRDNFTDIRLSCALLLYSLWVQLEAISPNKATFQ